MKNKEGNDSPATARAMLTAMWDRWIQQAGGVIDTAAREKGFFSFLIFFPSNIICKSISSHYSEPFIVEIPPSVSIDGNGIKPLVEGKTFSSTTILSF